MKHTLKAIIIALLALSLVSCSTPAGRAEHEVAIETTLPTEYGDVTLVLWPEPDIKGELKIDFINMEIKPGK